MTVSENRSRHRQPIEKSLAVAIALSLVIHLGLFGTWRLGQKLGWWTHHPSWLVKFTQKLTAAKTRPLQARQQPQNQRQEIPLSFLEVDPATAVEKPPENAKFYSTKNTVASNPDPDSKPVPKVDGQQEQVARLMDNEKPKPFPLQPSPPKPEEPPPPKTGQPAEKPGDIAFNKDPNTGLANTNKGVPPHERPRTLAQAGKKATLVGEKMRQIGGAEIRGRVAFDAKATPFGDYDLAFISAVETRWRYLIDNNLVTPRSGRVVCEFKLTYDGRITDMKIENNEVGEILGMFCRNAIEDNQRYAKWPDEMRRTINANSREIRFTFYYN